MVLTDIIVKHFPRAYWWFIRIQSCLVIHAVKLLLCYFFVYLITEFTNIFS